MQPTRTTSSRTLMSKKPNLILTHPYWLRTLHYVLMPGNFLSMSNTYHSRHTVFTSLTASTNTLHDQDLSGFSLISIYTCTIVVVVEQLKSIHLVVPLLHCEMRRPVCRPMLFGWITQGGWRHHTSVCVWYTYNFNLQIWTQNLITTG